VQTIVSAAAAVMSRVPSFSVGAVLDQFRAALLARDIIPPEPIVAGGRLHRCHAAGRNGRGDAAYVLHLDGLPAGGFENHRDGRDWEAWRFDLGRTPTTPSAQPSLASPRPPGSDVTKMRGNIRTKFAGRLSASGPLPGRRRIRTRTLRARPLPHTGCASTRAHWWCQCKTSPARCRVCSSSARAA
jgi:hypothetical protein